MQKITFDAKEKRNIDNLIEQWEQSGIITHEQALKMSQQVGVRGFDWKGVATVSLWISMVCLVLAFIAMFTDSWLFSVLEKIYRAPDWLFMLFFTVLAVGGHIFSQVKYAKNPSRHFFSEGSMMLSMLSWTAALLFFARVFEVGIIGGGLLILAGALIALYSAYIVKSAFIWVLGLIGIMVWIGVQTYSFEVSSQSFMWMNYPLRYTLTGALGLVILWAVPKRETIPFNTVTYVFALSTFFISLWLLSIFGNISSFEEWNQRKQIAFLFWGVLMLSICLAVSWYGFKKHDDWAKAFGIVFILVNIYTRYVEFFWGNTNKIVFFALLAVSFWVIGRKAETLRRKYAENENDTDYQSS